MKRKELWAALLVVFLCSVVFGQSPLRPQDATSAGVVKSVKWSVVGWSGQDTLTGPTDSVKTYKIFTGDAVWNRWSMRTKIDSIGTDPDSVSLRWRYKLNSDTAWSAPIVAGTIVANGYPVSGSISKVLVTSGLAEKPDWIELWVRLFDASGGDKAIVKKIEFVAQ